MDMILKNTFQSISPAYELIGDVTVGSNTTQVDFTGLSIGKDDELLLVSSLNNVIANTLEARLFINGNTTATNYYCQRVYAMGTTVGAGRFNFSTAIINDNIDTTLAVTQIKLTNNGYFAYQSKNARKINSASIHLDDWYGTSTFTSTSITRLTITSILTNAIGTGSRFQLYKLVAEKVADIIVPSNTTSVDITGLNIGKDGEYYLVSEIVGTGSSEMYLTINGNNTTTNYYNQRITAFSTTIEANRQNRPRFDGLASGNRNLSMANIKLTNSGYYIYQSNLSRHIGGSDIRIEKNYGTSTFAMSDITSMRISAEVSNAIGANSRFTLYRLK